jgi:uncharacterized protein (DUF433 family)
MEKRIQSLSLSVMFVPMIRITIDPAVMSGKPCIRGLRVTVANVLRQLANHRTPAEILASYPYLEAEDIDACLAYDAVVDEELAVGAA